MWGQLARACHPAPSATVTAIVVGLAIGAGSPPVAVAVLGVAVALGQLSVGWSNDAIDGDRDRRAGRTDKPVALGVLSPTVVWRAAAGAAVGCAVVSAALGARAALVHLAAVAAGWAYNTRLKCGPYSAVPYLAAFAAVPVVVAATLPGRPWPQVWVVAAAGLLGVGAHFVNVLPDLDADRAVQVRGLPQRLGAGGALSVGAASMAASLALLAAASERAEAALVVGLAAAAVLVGLVITGALGRARLAWRLAMLAAALVALAFVLSGGAALG